VVFRFPDNVFDYLIMASAIANVVVVKDVFYPGMLAQIPGFIIW
jgi:hypothetical protein